uniref:hypothetical protein n=1 Tax=Flagellimonas flava TaxID=570519 RepID=UPI003D64DBC5
MKLHEAIEQLLQEKLTPLTFSDIAYFINENELYQRKDGKPLKPNQIHARIKNYPDEFKVLNGYVILSKVDRAVNVYHLRRMKVSSANQVHEIDS